MPVFPMTVSSPPTLPPSLIVNLEPVLLPGIQLHAVYITCIAVTGQIFTDQTGRFPQGYTAENTDMRIMYCYNSNCIHVESMLSRTAYQILRVYKQTHLLLVSRGLRPFLQHLVNEALVTLIKFFDNEGVDF